MSQVSILSIAIAPELHLRIRALPFLPGKFWVSGGLDEMMWS